MHNHSEMMATVVAALERITKTIDSIESRLGLTEDRQQAVKELQKPPLLVTLTALTDEEAEKPNMSALDESALTDVVVEVTDDFAVVQSDSTLINPMELELVVDVVAKSSDGDFSLDVNPYLDSEKSTLIAVTNTVTEVTFEKIPITFLPVRVSMTEIGQVDKESGFKNPVGELGINISFCISDVCENDSVTEFLIFVAIVVLVGSLCSLQPFVAAAVSAEPPDKPPDKSIRTLPLLDSCLISKLLGISLRYAILHSLEGVFAVDRLDFDLLTLVSSRHINTWISHLRTWIEVYENSLQTIFISSDMRWAFTTSHSILCHWNAVQLIFSWFGKPYLLPTDDTGYFILWHEWLTKVGTIVLECLDMADFTFLLKHDVLISSDSAHKITGRLCTTCLRTSSGLEVILIVLDPIMCRLNLNSIYKHVMVHILWFDGAHGDKLYVQVVIAPWPGALSDTMSATKIYGEHVVAAIQGVLLHMLHFCRSLVVKHTDLQLENYLMTSNMVEDMLLEAIDFGEPLFIDDLLVVADLVGYFEVHSTKLDQPINKVWPAIVRFKGSAKLLFYKEPTTLYDIFSIEETTEGTSSSTFSVTFGTVGISKTTCKFTLVMHKRPKVTSSNDWQEGNIYLKSIGWQVYNPPYKNLVPEPTQITWYQQNQNQLFLDDSYFLETEESNTMSSSISGCQYNYVLPKNGEIIRYWHTVAQSVIISNMDDLLPFCTYPENWSKPDALYNYPSSSSYQNQFSKAAIDVSSFVDIFLANNKVFDGIHQPSDGAGETLSSCHYVHASTVIVTGPQDTLSRVESLIKISVPGCQWGDKGTKLALHLVSSGNLTKDTLCIIGNEVVDRLPRRFKEIDERTFNGVPCQGWIGIVVFAHVHRSFNLHQEVEGLTEVAFPKSYMGTTKKTSGTSYSGTITRNGLKVCGNSTVLLSAAAWDYVLNQNYVPTYDTSAWPIERWLEKMLLERPLQDDILANSIVLDDLTFGGNGFSYHVEKNGEHVYAAIKSKEVSFLFLEVWGQINNQQLQYTKMSLHMYGNCENQLLVQWSGHPLDASTWKPIASIPHEFPTFDLEDKVAFEKGSNVTDHGAKETEQDARRCVKEGTTANMERIRDRAVEGWCNAKEGTAANWTTMSCRAHKQAAVA